MSEIIAYAMGKIRTAIAIYKRSAIARDSLTFSDDDVAQLYKEFETWNTRSYVLTAKLKAYFPSSDIDMKWAEYSSLIVNVWELAARIYNTATGSEEIAIFVEDREQMERANSNRLVTNR